MHIVVFVLMCTDAGMEITTYIPQAIRIQYPKPEDQISDKYNDFFFLPEYVYRKMCMLRNYSSLYEHFLGIQFTPFP